jgi:hypothetical protein
VKYHKVGAIGALVAATLALAGCALTADPVAKPAGGAAPAKGAPAAAAEAIDACKLLTAAELKETFGKAGYRPSGSSTTIDDPVHLTNSTCMFVAKDDAAPFDVYVIVHQYDTNKSGDDLGSSGAKPVSGVGEAAVSVEAAEGTSAGPPTTQVRFVVGNKMVNVSKIYDGDRAPDDPAGDVTRVVDLAKKVASRL